MANKLPPPELHKVAHKRKRGAAETAYENLRTQQQLALDAASKVGSIKLARMLKRAQLTLEKRLPKMNPEAQFTVNAQAQTLAQLRLVSQVLMRGQARMVGGEWQPIMGERGGLDGIVREMAHGAALKGADAMMAYLVQAERTYSGITSLGPRFLEAMQLDVAVAGADATVLRRVATDPKYRGEEAQTGVIDRYGIAVVNGFEGVLQQAMLTGQPWGEVRASLTAESAWLQDTPRFWAERIARTECMAAINRAGQETMEQAQEQLGEMFRILVCVFDDRTSADSVAVHGQVRRMDEPFESWNGEFMSPPDRPNDRACVVPHMKDWPLPNELMPLPDSAVDAAWARDKRKGSPPPRPVMSTVPGIGMAE